MVEEEEEEGGRRRRRRSKKRKREVTPGGGKVAEGERSNLSCIRKRYVTAFGRETLSFPPQSDLESFHGIEGRKRREGGEGREEGRERREGLEVGGSGGKGGGEEGGRERRVVFVQPRDCSSSAARIFVVGKVQEGNSIIPRANPRSMIPSLSFSTNYKLLQVNYTECEGI